MSSCDLCQLREDLEALKGNTKKDLPTPPKLTLHKQLDRYLAKRQMTYRQLSELSGVSIKTLYHWRSGQRPFVDERLFAVAKVLQVDLVELLFGGG